MRTPMFGTRMPRYRTRAGMFDDMMSSEIRRLARAWPNMFRDLQFAVEDVPPSDPAPWEPQRRIYSQAFAAMHGSPARIVLYRLPIQMHCQTRLDQQLAIREELVLRLAELFSQKPEDIDPNWNR
ncbi:peptidase [Bifidobacterium dolichotidis]|uniref:Peptidase n=2 Tax=Bifidobacterium dolichotidis TaxID=2306976 RepID=A0A430FSM9_9BIFI|nr:peptidase [Bifidobacterium dolichotidis]